MPATTGKGLQLQTHKSRLCIKDFGAVTKENRTQRDDRRGVYALRRNIASAPMEIWTRTCRAPRSMSMGALEQLITGTVRPKPLGVE